VQPRERASQPETDFATRQEAGQIARRQAKVPTIAAPLDRLAVETAALQTKPACAG